MKFLVLLRHGIAEEKTAGMPDAERELTGEGRRKMKQVARSLAEIFPEAGAIYSSPLVRATQTAEAVARAYGGRLAVQIAAALQPQSSPKDFRTLLEQAGEDFAVFVGHEPNMTEIMLDLTGMRGAALSLKKGGIYGVRIEGGAVLEWMVPPRVLRA